MSCEVSGTDQPMLEKLIVCVGIHCMGITSATGMGTGAALNASEHVNFERCYDNQ